MLPFGDDYFSFLETYQERSNDEDESDNERSQMSSSSSFSVFSEGNDEQECTFTCTTSFDLPKSPVGPDTSESQEDSDNEDEGVEGGWDELIASFRERVVSVVSMAGGNDTMKLQIITILTAVSQSRERPSKILQGQNPPPTVLRA
mmetsp:Transcript_12012/g.19849  ORF Transcript_12012/g.19849 Transcript_12012/m.19849 type:complete len:146 (+) Transcript_12012:249-686(+)